MLEDIQEEILEPTTVIYEEHFGRIAFQKENSLSSFIQFSDGIFRHKTISFDGQDFKMTDDSRSFGSKNGKRKQTEKKVNVFNILSSNLETNFGSAFVCPKLIEENLFLTVFGMPIIMNSSTIKASSLLFSIQNVGDCLRVGDAKLNHSLAHSPAYVKEMQKTLEEVEVYGLKDYYFRQFQEDTFFFQTKDRRANCEVFGIAENAFAVSQRIQDEQNSRSCTSVKSVVRTSDGQTVVEERRSEVKSTGENTSLVQPSFIRRVYDKSGILVSVETFTYPNSSRNEKIQAPVGLPEVIVFRDIPYGNGLEQLKTTGISSYEQRKRIYADVEEVHQVSLDSGLETCHYEDAFQKKDIHNRFLWDTICDIRTANISGHEKHALRNYLPHRGTFVPTTRSRSGIVKKIQS